MNVLARLRKQLESAREVSEAMLKSFQKPEQWTFQVHDSANHALWFAGHMAVVDNFFVSLIDPSKQIDTKEYRKMFGMGSTPSGDPGDYPPPEEVLARMRDRRTALLEALDALSEEDLERKTPESAPEFLPDLASVFEAAIWHEGVHSGQLSVARRALGYPPLFAAPPQPASA